jgi:hypothetical protein
LLAIKYNLFQLPSLNEKTIFSLTKTSGHIFANEVVVGILWTFPLIISLAILPKFLSNVVKENKKIFGIIILMLVVAIVNLFATSFIGMVIRYFFEYMSLMVIISIILFYYVYSREENRSLKIMLNIYFILFFVYSLFINISCLFCENYSAYYARTSAGNYIKIINFLFG